MAVSSNDAVAPTSPNSVAPGPPLWRRWMRRLIRALVFLTAIMALLVAAHRPLLIGFALLFRVDDPAPSDAMVVLLGGAPHRPRKAAELYREGLAPLILLCRERPDPILPPDLDTSALIKDYLVRLGVPSSAIVILPGEVASTRDEAERVRAYFQGRSPPARRITVVTTSFHTRRARRVVRRVLGDVVSDVRCAAADDPNFDESNWYRTEDGLVHYFAETIKSFYYWVKY